MINNKHSEPANNSEIWKDVVGWEGLYRVSNLGRVASVERTINYFNVLIGQYTDKKLPGIILKLQKNKYNFVWLNNQYRKKMFLVHRLVSIAFIPNELNHPMVNHKNGIKTDNRIENLEWCTAQHNARHAFSTGLNNMKQLEKVRWQKGQKAPNAIVVLNTQTGIFYETLKDAANSINIHSSTLCPKLKGKKMNNTSFIYA